MMSDYGRLDSRDHDASILINKNVNPNVNFLEDVMNNRLTVSSDSGMVNPVKTEAAEKEIEQSHVCSEENRTSHSPCLNLDKACKDEYEQRLLEQKVEPCGEKSLLLEKTIEKSEDLSQLSREQLISHFKSEMIQLKREHDYKIQEMTEEYFSIKRRCLNLEERGSFSCLKKDKEFDIISKLDKVLSEDDYKSQLDSLLAENRQLKDSLSVADQNMSRLSQAEENHRKLIRKLESDVEDSHVEASIYVTVMGEFLNQVQCAKEKTDLEHRIMRKAYNDLISRDLVKKEEDSESKIDLEDSCCVEYCAVIYKETLKEADKRLRCLNMNVSEKEGALRSEMVENERLKEEIHCLECLVKEKENLVLISENDLATEREKLEIVSQQINNLQFQIDQQEVVIKDKNNELKAVSAHGLEIREGYEMEIFELRQNLESVRKITENEKVESELKLSSAEAEQKRLKNQFVSTVLSLDKWSRGFVNLECLVTEEIKKIDSRLESMQSQLSDLLDEVDELKVRESMYKQQMEKKTCNLQKAETEVDHLGDEIETFLDLLGKIYIALDHYSPILKHYPGIIEILKLVRRELRRESKRLSVF